MWAIVFGPQTKYKSITFNLQAARNVAVTFNSLRLEYSTHEEALAKALVTLNLPGAKQNNVKAYIVKVPNNG